MPPKKPKPFRPSKAAELEFGRALKKVARTSGHIVEAHVDGHKLRHAEKMKLELETYSELLSPWARSQAARMLQKISNSNSIAFKKSSREFGKMLRTQIAESGVGQVAAKLMDEQVDLIKSIPVRAGQRAQELALNAMVDGSRASEIAEELQRSTEVSESDAARIARTEVARANASITEARAKAAGSRQYRWRNAHDGAVRESHRIYKGKRLDGMVFSWDEPPTLDDGSTGHPGTFPNCRCYPEPFFPEDDL